MGTCWGKNAAAAGEGAGSKQAAGSSTTGFRKLGPGPDSARGPADSDHGIGSPASHRDRRGSSVDMLVGGGKGVRQQQQQQDGAQMVHDEDGDAEGGGHRPSQHSAGMHTPAKSASWASSASKHHQHPAGHERLISSPPLHDGPYNDGDDDERYRKMTYLKRGIVKFNGNAKQGIEYLISHGLLERDPQSIASFLHSAGTSVLPADANVSSSGAANAYLSPVPAGNNSQGRGVVMKSPAPPSGGKPKGTALSSAAENAGVAQATGADGVKSLLHNALSPQLQQHWQEQPLNRVRIGEYLGSIGGKDDASRRFQRQLLEAYVALFSFEAQSLVAALRAFLSSFRLPGEAQVIDRIMSCFSSAYHRDNPNTFRTSDAAYVLSFGAIMLNTDLHKREVKRKMTLEQFCANMRGIDGGLDVDPAVLTSIYQDIAAFPLASDVDCDVVTFFAPARQSWLLKRCSGGVTRWKKRYFLLTDGCLYYFLSPQDVSAARPRCILPLENAAVEAVGSTGLRIVPLPPSYSTAPTMAVSSSATAAEQQIPNWTNSPMKQLHADLAGSNGSPSPMLLKQQRQQSRNVALSLKSAKRNNDGQLTRGTHRDFQLRASNPADRDAWLSALSAHTQNGSADRIRRMSTVKSATIAMVATSAANAAGLQSPAGVHDKGQLLPTSSFGDLRTSAVDVSAVRNGGDDDAGLHLINGAASGAFDTDEQHLHHHPLGIDAPVAADEDRIALGPRHQRTNGSRVDESETGLLVAPSNSSSNNNNISGSNKALGIVSSSSASNLMISAAGSSGASAASGIGRAAAGAALSAGSQGIVAPQAATSAASSGAAAGHTPRLTPRLHSPALRAPPTPPASLPLQLVGSQPQQQQSSASGAASGAGSGSTSYPHRSTPLLAPPPPGPSRESSTASAAGNFIGGGGVAGALAAPMLSLSLSSLVPSQGTAAGSAAPLISPLALPTVSGLNSSSYNDNGVSSGGGGAGAMPVPPSSQSASAPPLPLSSSSAASSFSLSQLNASAASGSGVQIGDDAHAQLLHLAVAAMSTINGGTASSIPVAAAVNGSNGSGSAFVARAAAGGVATGSSTISAASTPSLRPLRAPTNISATATAANTAAAVSTSMDDIIIGRANTEDEFDTSTLLDTASDLSSIDDDDSIHFGHMDQLQTTHEEAFDEDDDDEHQRQQLDEDDADGDAAGRQSQGAPRGAGFDSDDVSLANASAASAMQHGSASGASKSTQSKQVVWTTGRAGSQSSSPAVDELAGPAAAARGSTVSMKASAASVNSSINSTASSSLNAIAGQISRATAATAARFRILGGGARAHAGGFERTRTHDVDEATNAGGSNPRHRHRHADGQLSNGGSGDDDDDDDAGIGRWRARVTSEESEDDKVLHHGNERGTTPAAPGLASNPTATLASSGSSSAAPPPIPPPPRHRDLQVKERQILAPFGRRNQARRHSDDQRQQQQDNDEGGGEMLEPGLGYIRGGNSSSETSTALQAPASAASNSSINSTMSSGAAHHLAHTRTASISPPASYAHALVSAPGASGDRGVRVQADAAPALDLPAPRLTNLQSPAVPAATVVVRRGAGTPGRLLPPQPQPSQRQQSVQSAASSSSVSPRILAIGGSHVDHHHHQQQYRQHHALGAHRTDDGTSTSAVASRRPREGSDAQLLTTATGSSSSSDFAPLSAVLTSEVFDASSPSATTRSLRGPAAGAAAESLHPPFPMPAASASTATGVAPAIPVPSILLNRNISAGSAIDTVEVSLGLALDGGISDGVDHADTLSHGNDYQT